MIETKGLISSSNHFKETILGLCAVAGAILGLYNTLTNTQKSEVEIIKIEREMQVASFQSQIDDLEDLDENDKADEIKRKRIQYEDNFQARDKVSKVGEIVNNISGVGVSHELRVHARKILDNTKFATMLTQVDQRYLAATYLAAGDYSKSISYYKEAIAEHPNDANLPALLAVSLGAKAESLENSENKTRLRTESLEQTRKALSMGVSESTIKEYYEKLIVSDSK